jgi:hypothetical protein
LILVLAAGLSARLWLAWNFHGTFDVSSWERIFEFWRTGASPYDAARLYSYSPVWFWILSATSRVFSGSVPAHFAVKLPLIAADVVLFFLIRRLACKGKAKLLAPAAFFLNPVSLLNTGFHGQFDNIAYVFVLLACVLSPKASSGLSYFFSAAVKHSTLLLAPLFAFREKGILRQALFLALAPVFFLLSLVPYFLARDAHIFQNVFVDSVNLRLWTGAWGWSLGARYVISWMSGIDIQSDPRYAFLPSLNFFLVYPALCALAWSFAKKGKDLVGSAVVYLLFFYTFTVQMAPQYTFWLIPFAALTRGRWFYAWSAVTAAHLTGFYLWGAGVQGVGIWITVFRFAAWVVGAIWLASELQKASSVKQI